MAYFYGGPDEVNGGTPLFPTVDAIKELRDVGGDAVDIAAEKLASDAKRQGLGGDLDPGSAAVLDKIFSDRIAASSMRGPLASPIDEAPVVPKTAPITVPPPNTVAPVVVAPAPKPVTTDGIYYKPNPKQGLDAVRYPGGGTPMGPTDYIRAVLTANAIHPNASFEGGDPATGYVGVPVYRGAGNQTWVAGASNRALEEMSAREAEKAARDVNIDLARAKATAIPIETETSRIGAQAALIAAKMNAALKSEQLMRLHGIDSGAGFVDPQTGKTIATPPQVAISHALADPLFQDQLKNPDVAAATRKLAELGVFGSAVKVDENGNPIPGDAKGEAARRAWLYKHQDELAALARDVGWSMRQSDPGGYASFKKTIETYFPTLSHYFGASPEGTGESIKDWLFRPRTIKIPGIDY